LPEDDDKCCGVGIGVLVGLGDPLGKAIGFELGNAVGLDIIKRSQSFDVDSMQVGLNELNCSIVSNTDEN